MHCRVIQQFSLRRAGGSTEHPGEAMRQAFLQLLDSWRMALLTDRYRLLWSAFLGIIQHCSSFHTKLTWADRDSQCLPLHKPLTCLSANDRLHLQHASGPVSRCLICMQHHSARLYSSCARTSAAVHLASCARYLMVFLIPGLAETLLLKGVDILGLSNPPAESAADYQAMWKQLARPETVTQASAVTAGLNWYRCTCIWDIFMPQSAEAAVLHAFHAAWLERSSDSRQVSNSGSEAAESLTWPCRRAS